MNGGTAHTWRLAVWILVASEALLFAGLFALYAAYRTEYPAAFAHAAGHSVQWMGGVMSIILIGSSVAMTLAVHDARADRGIACARWLLVVMVIGAAFIALKLVEWFVHIDDGIVAGVGYHGPDEGRGTKLFFTLYFLMTGLHVLHLVVGIALVAWVFVLARRGAVLARVLPVELVGVYWNFVDAIWMFLWPMFYLMRRA